MKQNIKNKKFRLSTEEFAQFLKHEDGNLIDFNSNCSEIDPSDCEQEDICDPSPKKIKLADERIGVTKDVISSWIKHLQGNFPEGFQDFTLGFKASVCFTSSTKVESLKYEVSDIEIHKLVITASSNDVVPLLKKYLSLQGPKSKKSSPASSHKWSNIQPIMKDYLTCALKLLDEMEMSSLELGLKLLADLSQFYVCFQNLIPTYVVKLVNLWGGSCERRQTLADKCLVTLMDSANESTAKFALWKLYLCLMRLSRNTSAKTIARISTAKESLVRLLCTKPNATHAILATCMNQMHKAVDSIQKKKDAWRVICDWQFFHSLSVWAEVIGLKNDNDKIKSLIGPLISLILKTVEVNISPVYAPLRMSCVRILIGLSKNTNIFVPSLMSIIIEPLRWRLFEDGADNSNLKSFVYATRLHLSKWEIGEKVFLEETFNEVIDLLLRYTILISNSINFPTIVDEVFKQAKVFSGTCIVPKYTKKLEQVVSKIKAVSDKIEKKRRSDAIDLKDKKALNSWEEELKNKNKELEKFYDVWLRERSKQLEKDMELEKASLKEEGKASGTKSKTMKSKAEEDSSDSEDDVDVDEFDDDDNNNNDDDGGDDDDVGDDDEDEELFHEDDEEPLDFDEN